MLCYIVLYFSGMYKLMSVSLCVLVGNAEAERIFSCQNRIKTKLRNQLNIVTLDQLVRLSYENIDPDDFPYAGPVQEFLQGKRRL